MFKALKNSCQYKGACHADDIFYLFTTAYHEPPTMDSKDFKTIQRMVGMFTSFAIEGTLNCQEVEHLKINAYDGSSPMKCININRDDVTVIPLPEEENLKVWDSIYESHHVPLY